MSATAKRAWLVFKGKSPTWLALLKLAAFAPLVYAALWALFMWVYVLEGSTG